MIDVTAIIVIKNNPPYLNKTLESINDFVSEIIIGTINVNISLINKLKANNKIKFVSISPIVPYADIVKEDLKKMAKGKYILYIDPDEIFPKKVFPIIQNKIDRFDQFYFPRKNIIFNQWIQHSRWWPDYQLRFFKKDSVIWPKTIHPQPKAEGVGFRFEAREKYAIIHYNYQNLDDYFEKAFRYAKSEAKKYIIENKSLTLGESIKKSINEFISRYFACDGYKDGIHGFILAVLQMIYYLLVYIYYWEEKKYFNVDNKTILKETRYFFANGTKEINYWLDDKKLITVGNRIKNKLLNKIINLFGL